MRGLGGVSNGHKIPPPMGLVKNFGVFPKYCRMPWSVENGQGAFNYKNSMLFKFQEIILVHVEIELWQGQKRSSRQAREGAWTRMVSTSEEDRADTKYIL